VERIELLESHVSSRAHANKCGDSPFIGTILPIHALTHPFTPSVLPLEPCTHSFIHTLRTFPVINSELYPSCYEQHTRTFLPLSTHMYLSHRLLFSLPVPCLNVVSSITYSIPEFCCCLHLNRYLVDLRAGLKRRVVRPMD
jgi:hypothetical protein